MTALVDLWNFIIQGQLPIERTGQSSSGQRQFLGTEDYCWSNRNDDQFGQKPLALYRRNWRVKFAYWSIRPTVPTNGKRPRWGSPRAVGEQRKKKNISKRTWTCFRERRNNWSSRGILVVEEGATQIKQGTNEGKTGGTREHRGILEGKRERRNQGPSTPPPGRPYKVTRSLWVGACNSTIF